MVFIKIKRFLKKFSKNKSDLDPDEIFLDSKNLPRFDISQFEGRIEKPITVWSIVIFSSVCVLLLIILLSRAWTLQIKEGEIYASKSENNRLRHELIFSDRGAIFDRNGVKLAWNSISNDGEELDFSLRSYIKKSGFSHTLGYVKYPQKDKNGFYFQENFEGIEGVEKTFDKLLSGEQGLKIIETDALGETESESTMKNAKPGENLFLSIDVNVQAKLHELIKELALRVGFTGGSGAIMDINTGEIIAMTSFPEYDSNIMISGDQSKIKSFTNDSKNPFLNRFLGGLYTPGSVVKPYVALAALSENIIDPEKEILSTGSISIQNPYDPDKKTVFSDWKEHGYVDMRKAIAVSSNVYFYEIGGGFEDQKGLGISKLNQYFSIFGFGKENTDPFFGGPNGTIPSPSWKEKNFPGDPWRIGDTYFTAIGQYGFQVTPLQELLAVASIANDGFLLKPTILKIGTTTQTEIEKKSLPFSKEQINVIKEGMRQSAVIGTASGLNVPYVEIAAKTGTAELGVSKKFVNSWAVGFFPYDNPRYVFSVVMEHGPRANTYGGVYVMRGVFDWMNIYAEEYLE